MPPIHANARDIALRRLSRTNRWMIAGSVALTAVFSEVAASAFPGRSSKAGNSATGTRSHAKSTTSTTTESLKAPSEAPRSSATPEVSHSQEAPPAEQSSPGASEPSPPRESQEAAPSQESAPPVEHSAPAKEEPAPAPQPAPAPAETSPPVVSGGS